MGWEVGFGAVLQLSPTLMIEGRLRGLREAYAWKPTSASAAGDSSQTNTFIILDLGLGYRF
jgi:hypothetical protein